MSKGSKFSFGPYGGLKEPPLKWVLFYRTITSHFEPGGSWFTSLYDKPYGEGLPGRLHKKTLLKLSPVFNFNTYKDRENKLKDLFSKASYLA